MTVHRGDIWWADLPEPKGSEPGYRRPVLIISAESFNRSAIRTVIAAVITSNLKLAAAPGNFKLASKLSGLTKDSVVNISQIVTLDKSFLREFVGRLPSAQIRLLDSGLKLSLSL